MNVPGTTAVAALALLLVACGGEEQTAEAPPPALEVTAEAIGHYCGMQVTTHDGPKGQIHLASREDPVWFTSVRDTVAFTRLPEEPKDITAIYVNDMARAKQWDQPEPGTWIRLDEALLVIDPYVIDKQVDRYRRGKRTLTEAEDPAAALTWRISALTPLPHRDAPLPWLPHIPPALRQEPGTSTYLDRLTGRIDDLKQRVADQAQQAGASDRVPWQRMLPPDVDEQLLGDLAVWRAAHAVPPTEPRSTGAPVKDPDVARHQTRLTRRLNPPSPPRGRPMEGTAGERLRASQRQAEQHARYGNPSSEVPGPSR